MVAPIKRLWLFGASRGLRVAEGRVSYQCSSRPCQACCTLSCSPAWLGPALPFPFPVHLLPVLCRLARLAALSVVRPSHPSCSPCRAQYLCMSALEQAGAEGAERGDEAYEALLGEEEELWVERSVESAREERAPDDGPSIGIILCAEKDRLEVEFSLKSKANPIGVATYQLHPSVPAELMGRLPTEADWRRLLESTIDSGKDAD